MIIILANICATRYGFINKKFVNIFCQVFKIELQYLIKLKQIQRFDSKAAKSITYTIYLTLTVDIHIKNFVPLLIIKLRNHFMILGQL